MEARLLGDSDSFDRKLFDIKRCTFIHEKLCKLIILKTDTPVTVTGGPNPDRRIA